MGNSKSKPTKATLFKDCFNRCWDQQAKQDYKKLSQIFEESSKLTEFMLHKCITHDSGHLEQVCECYYRQEGRDDMRFHTRDGNDKHEYYHLDAYAYQEGDEAPHDHLHMILEHENDTSRIKEEFRKLLDLRSPLKVLVFYGWNDDGKATAQSQDKLLPIISELDEMNSKTYEVHPEAKDTEYLLIVGNRNSNMLEGEKYGEIQWRFWSAAPNTKFKKI